MTIRLFRTSAALVGALALLTWAPGARAEPPDESSPEEPAPPDPAPEAEKSDPEALEYLRKAAERQGAGSLALVDGVQSFNVLFHTVWVVQEQVQEDGTVQRTSATSDVFGMEIDWMAPDKIRTRWVIDGETTLRGSFKKANGLEIYWLNDGKETTPLTGPRYEKDREELQRDRRTVRALLDVAVLHKMLVDGSVWKLASDPLPYEADGSHVALRRKPPASDTEDGRSLALTLWLERTKLDPVAVRLEAAKPGAPTLYYQMSFHNEFPQVEGTDNVRFPFHVIVWEQHGPAGELSKILELKAAKVRFNEATGITDATFKAPKSEPR